MIFRPDPGVPVNIYNSFLPLDEYISTNTNLLAQHAEIFDNFISFSPAYHPFSQTMITTTGLHRHELDLLPPEAGKIISLMVEFLENASVIEQNQSFTVEKSFYPYNELIFPDLFNFSLNEAIDIVIEHKKKIDRVFLPHVEAILIFSYAALISWGLISNCLLSFVVTRQCTRKTMTNNGPSPRNLYIVNLAVADLLLCIICMPFTLLALLRRRWFLGSLMCKLVPVIQGSNIMVSSGTITAIAFDRYFTIVRSPRRTLCRCSVATTLILVWLISFVTMFPLILFQQIETVKLGDIILHEVCLEKWPSRNLQKIYTLSLTTSQFILPVIVLTIVHLKISLYLNVHLNGPPRSTLCKRANREVRRNRRTMWILSCIAIVFTFSWLPLTVFTIVVEFKFYVFKTPTTLYITFIACHLLAMSSAGTNPLLYGYLNTNFRRDLASLYFTIFGIKPDSRNRSNRRRRRTGSQTLEGKQMKEEGKSANTTEPLSVVVKSRDRRTSSSFGTTLTTTFRTRSSSCNISQPKIEEL